MNRSLSFPIAAGVMAAGALVGFAQDDAPEPVGLHFRFGPQIMFNYKLTIRDGQHLPAFDPNVYDNGFVKPDSSSTFGNTNRTANWGYTDPTAYWGPADQTKTDKATLTAPRGVNLTRYDNVPRAGDIGGSSLTGIGGELFAAYEISDFRAWKKLDGHWGLELGYGFNSIETSGSSSASGTIQRVQTQYTAVTTGNPKYPEPIIPHAPYYGNFAPVGGQTVYLDPQGVSLPGASAPGIDSLQAKTSVDMHTLKIGPWVDLPITKKLNLNLGLGYCAVFADAELQMTETLNVTTADPSFVIPPEKQPPTGPFRAARRQWRPGWYGQARFEYEFNPRWGAFVGGEFQHNSNLIFGGGGREVSIQMGSGIGATAGVRFSF